MNTISTHVLDTSIGRPAAGVPVALELLDGQGRWRTLGSGATDPDGRARNLGSEHGLGPGRYRLRFESGGYFREKGAPTFYPFVEVTFVIESTSGHYHVPLLISPFGYSTYRGS